MISRRKFLAGAALAAGALPFLPEQIHAGDDASAENALLPSAKDLFFPYSLPPLPYPYDALEPHLDAETMMLHHQRHHAAYVNNLNKALEDHSELQKLSLHELLTSLDKLPSTLARTLLNNGGGHINHSILWVTMSSNPNLELGGNFSAAVDRDMGGFDEVKNQLRASAMSVFGSGWAWLVCDDSGKLSAISLPNQDPPLISGLHALLGIDVWEHAYYLKFQNKRADFISAFLETVDWKKISDFYNKKFS